MGLTPSFWRGRRVLLTGHTGFKGTWLALWLEMLGAEVAAFALEPEAEALWARLTPAPVWRSATVDLRDAQAVARAVDEAAPQLVLHLDRPLPVEPKPLWLNSAQARQALGWTPRLDFADTIGWTMDWWRRLARGETARAICERQIATYSELHR